MYDDVCGHEEMMFQRQEAGYRTNSLRIDIFYLNYHFGINTELTGLWQNGKTGMHSIPYNTTILVCTADPTILNYPIVVVGKAISCKSGQGRLKCKLS